MTPSDHMKSSWLCKASMHLYLQFVHLTLGGFTVSDHERSNPIPWGQQLPLCILSAHAFKEPTEQQEKGQL